MDAPEVPHFFWHLVPHLFVHILGMLWNFCIFSGHLLKHQGCFFSDIPDTPRTCITFGICISDISDIQWLIYLCTFCWCSGSFALFAGHLSEYQGCFCWICWTLPRHVYIWHISFQIFQTFSASFICAHSADSPEVPHFSRTITWAPGLFLSDIPDIPGTCITFLHVDGIFISDILDIQPPSLFLQIGWCSRSSPFFQPIYLNTWVHISGTWITFGILISDISGIYPPNLFVHIWLMLRKFHIFLGHCPKH